ncbi:MAG: glycosyltransferase [Bacteroidales bacterium]|nr:glycosyltransferase [Bacteroidales bacterium]
MKISIIVCTYNRDDYISKALNSLARQTLSTSQYEIIIVNNNSTDNTDALCQIFLQEHQQLNARYFIETQQGLSYARNRGIVESSGDILVFMDDDAQADEHFLQEIRHFFETTTDATACGGRIYPDFESKRPDWMSCFLLPLTSTIDKGDNIKLFKGTQYPIGANMAFRREMFQQYGMFNPDLGRKGDSLDGSEEKDIFLKIKKEKGKIYYLPSAIVKHQVPDRRLTFDFFKRQAIGVGKSEQIRAKAISQSAYVHSVFKELVVKWGASVVTFLGYSITFRPQKGWKLLQFRYHVSKGLLSNHKIEKA